MSSSLRKFLRANGLPVVAVAALMAWATIGCQKSAASVKWTVNATSQFGAAVNGFFTLDSGNQILAWNIVVGPDAATPGHTFSTGQFSEFQPGIYLFATNSNFLFTGPDIEFAPPVATLAGLTGSLPLTAPNSFFLLSSPTDFEQISGTLTGTTVVVPEVTSSALLSLLITGGICLVRFRLRRTA